jgi:rubrerythrin
MSRTSLKPQPSSKSRPPELLRKLIDVAMDLERRTMQLYCRFESMFPEPAEVRAFWFDMAQHESRHFGALALVAGLLEGAPERDLPAAPTLTREHVVRFRQLLAEAEAEAQRKVTLKRAFEIALAIESSEIEDLVLDLLTLLKGESERERAVQLLIHDLGDLSYMIEKYGNSKSLLARADRSIERQLDRLRTRRSVVTPLARRGGAPSRSSRSSGRQG